MPWTPRPELITGARAAGSPTGRGVTFWALGEMVKAQAGILESDGPRRGREARRPSDAALPSTGDAAWIEAIYAPSSVWGGWRAGGTTARRVVRGLAALLRGACRASPLVLVFEDLHWADDGLLDFVDYLMDWSAEVPLLVVCTAARAARATAGLGRREGERDVLSLRPR